MDFIKPTNLQSSANEYNLAKRRQKLKLFMNIFKRSRKRCDPCGAPDIIIIVKEMKFLYFTI